MHTSDSAATYKTSGLCLYSIFMVNCYQVWIEQRTPTQYEDGIFFFDDFFQKVLKTGEIAQPIIVLLRPVPVIPVGNIFVAGVFIRQILHVVCNKTRETTSHSISYQEHF